MTESAKDNAAVSQCWMCSEPAVAEFEGIVPPASTVRRKACEEHAPDGLSPLRYLDAGDGNSRLVTDGGRDESAIGQFISSESDEWATPPEFVRPLADAVGGFDLDPASGAEASPVAEETFTAEDDGLSSAWFGTVWCNPPYSEMAEWTAKAVNESNREGVDTILFLVKGDSSTEWWQTAAEQASAIAMIDGRLSFGDADAAPFCSHVFVFGDLPPAAMDVLDRRGLVFRAENRHTRTRQETIA